MRGMQNSRGGRERESPRLGLGGEGVGRMQIAVRGDPIALVRGAGEEAARMGTGGGAWRAGLSMGQMEGRGE